ncbi:hypothetical protein EV401DRAFT_2012495, partial [Pisolithus croceorrhizus]
MRLKVAGEGSIKVSLRIRPYKGCGCVSDQSDGNTYFSIQLQKGAPCLMIVKKNGTLSLLHGRPNRSHFRFGLVKVSNDLEFSESPSRFLAHRCATAFVFQDNFSKAGRISNREFFVTEICSVFDLEIARAKIAVKAVPMRYRFLLPVFMTTRRIERTWTPTN